MPFPSVTAVSFLTFTTQLGRLFRISLLFSITCPWLVIQRCNIKRRDSRPLPANHLFPPPPPSRSRLTSLVYFSRRVIAGEYIYIPPPPPTAAWVQMLCNGAQLLRSLPALSGSSPTSHHSCPSALLTSLKLLSLRG